MSDAPPSFYDPAGSLVGGAPVLDIVSALLEGDEGEGLRVLELGERFATLVGRAQRPVRVFITPADASSLSELIDQLLQHNTRAGTEVIFVGGSAALTEVIERALPELLMNPFLAFHVADGGTITALPRTRAKKSKRPVILGRARRLSPTERSELLSRLEGHAQSFHEERKERVRFFKGLSGRRAHATLALLAAIVVMFVLQSLWEPAGADRQTGNVFLLAMGALYQPLVADGEWWRMISVGFLHADLLHVGMNSFVLYLLGGQVERVLGTPRFVVLYVVSLLAASLASAQFGPGFSLGSADAAREISVGASGAVWGLLGAQISLAYGRPPVLPRSIAEAMKPMAKQNILLNLGISFLPGIDAAAHIGGGLAGALLLASGVLYPTGFGTTEAEKEEKSRHTPSLVVILAAASVFLLVYGIWAALSNGRPWEMAEALRAMRES